MINQMLNYEQAARYLNISPRQVRRLVNDGKLGVVRVSYKNVLIPMDDISNYLRSAYERKGQEGATNGAKVG